MTVIRYAFDRSARSFDENGHLHVEVTNISKAAVNPYYGREIPRSEELGLMPDKVYNLLRDPSELAKSVDSFNGLPVMDVHIPVSAADSHRERIVGTTGTGTVFEHPYLKTPMVIWDGDAIKGIETGEKRQLSCGYRYDADMTPGEYEGVSYDGVMRNIKGNHVALVEVGRAGSDVIVNDSKPTNSKGAAVSAPKLKGLKMPATKEAALDAVLAKLKPFLAADADMDKVKDCMSQDDDDMDDDDEDEDEAKKKAAADKKAKDDAEEEAKKRADADKSKDDDKKAMDAAIKAATDKVKADMIAVREAERVVLPLVGHVHGMDSAEAIYAYALKQHGVDTTNVHPSAFPALIKTIGRSNGAPAMATDASAKTLADLVPSINRVRKA